MMGKKIFYNFTVKNVFILTFCTILSQLTQQIIEDRKPFIDDLNATGLELMELCGDTDAGEIQTKLVSDNERFEKLKHQARSKVRELADIRQNMTQEVGSILLPAF